MKLIVRIILIVSFIFLFVLGSAQSFASFSVEPNTTEEFDIVTGISELPDGGKVIDQDSGITIIGDYVRYQEGEFIEVLGATVDGNFGKMVAPEITVDLVYNTLSAFGDVELTTANLSITTQDVYLYLDPSIIIAYDKVVSIDPPFESLGAVLDTTAQQGFLLPSYVYQDGLFLLRSETEKLQLTWFADNQGQIIFETTDDLDPDVINKLQPYLPQN